MDDEIETATNQASRNTPPQDAIDHILIDAFARCIAFNNPEADNDANDIHQAIPAQGKRANMGEDRIDIDIDVWGTDTQPAPTANVCDGEIQS